MAILPNLPPSLKLWRDKLRHTPSARWNSKYDNVWMPVPMTIGMVKIIAFLDLEQNFSFLDGH
jgi:hypothetical protein